MFFNRRLFREEAVARRGRVESLDDLLRVTAPHEWLIVTGLGVAILGVVAWGLFGRIEQSLAAECVLVRPGERYAVVSEFSGTVTEVLVDAGALVETGQAIARIRLPELSREARIARARVAMLEAEADRSSGAPRTGDALLAARAELLELEAIEAAGGVITTPDAGEVTAHALVPGQSVAAGAEVARVRTVGDDRGVEAVAFVSPEDARRVETGMEAQVLPVALHGGTRALDAEVRDISSRPAVVPGWLARLGLPVPARSHLIRLTLGKMPDPPVADGTHCRLRIVLRRHRPLLLLAPSGTG